MQLATGNNMLNFGYWEDHATDPQTAQNKLCELIGKTADLKAARTVLDIGSGFSAPAFYWKSQYEGINITCINTNFQQLLLATMLSENTSGQKVNFILLPTNDIRFVNATSTSLPLADNSVDRIIALESAQHFKPLDQFIRESKRVLRKEGLFVIAIPIIKTSVKSSLFMKLGILSLTWASEHYNLDHVKSAIIKEGFNIDAISLIGIHVYDPLADYYMKNRKYIKEKILKKYPSYLEKILHKSLLKMKEVSQKGIIDYAIIKCTVR